LKESLYLSKEERKKNTWPDKQNSPLNRSQTRKISPAFRFLVSVIAFFGKASTSYIVHLLLVFYSYIVYIIVIIIDIIGEIQRIQISTIDTEY